MESMHKKFRALALITAVSASMTGCALHKEDTDYARDLGGVIGSIDICADEYSGSQYAQYMHAALKSKEDWVTTKDELSAYRDGRAHVFANKGGVSCKAIERRMETALINQQEQEKEAQKWNSVGAALQKASSDLQRNNRPIQTPIQTNCRTDSWGNTSCTTW